MPNILLIFSDQHRYDCTGYSNDYPDRYYEFGEVIKLRRRKIKTDMIKGNNDCALPLEVHFSHEHCQVLADMNSHLQPDYRQLFEKYPFADGLRDISICLSASQPDTEALIQGVKEGKFSWIGIINGMILLLKPKH